MTWFDENYFFNTPKEDMWCKLHNEPRRWDVVRATAPLLICKTCNKEENEKIRALLLEPDGWLSGNRPR